MSKRDKPDAGHELFPDAWIVGKVAADLDLDRGLEDDLPLAERTPILRDEHRSGPAALADLQRDLDQLRGRVTDTQARISPIDEQITELGANLTALRDAPDRQMDALQAEIARVAGALADHARRQRRANWIHTLLLLIAIGLGALFALSVGTAPPGGAPAGAAVSTVDGALQRLRGWFGDMREALASGVGAADSAGNQQAR